ncbi:MULTISPECIES: hypothetical protein [unclassified Saccharopolyspora]|uniref:hypothetical protein n=1 Tax=unclassified Saccharopolyspora TaxID=2646250 RepID=UPI001CD77421|nr:MULTISPECIES: hypothetical protein [unclassified Saccharopolyspora]MCA1185489.1 hypothetical protein [Saccharopolyspora sp. 6T]MCA1192288.1 hypothetical protein [Saccharopolyspora sp. 6V]MCA1279591.1 hypothetical protein [Saccharopolyspora sp. 7B]
MTDQRNDDMDMPRRAQQEAVRGGARHRPAPQTLRRPRPAAGTRPGEGAEQPGAVPFRSESPTRPRRERVEWHDEDEFDADDAEAAAVRGHRGAAGTRIGTWFRGLTGSLALGLLLVALALIGVQVWATRQGQDGPGTAMIVSHAVAAVLALVLQRFADRNRDRRGAAALLAVLVAVFGTLWFWWWL